MLTLGNLRDFHFFWRWDVNFLCQDSGRATNKLKKISMREARTKYWQVSQVNVNILSILGHQVIKRETRYF